VELSGRVGPWLFGFLSLVLTGNAFSQTILNSGNYYNTTAAGTLIITAAQNGSQQVQDDLYIENPYVNFCGGSPAILHYMVVYQIQSDYANTPIDFRNVPAPVKLHCTYTGGGPFTLVAELKTYQQSFQQSTDPRNILATQDNITSIFTNYIPTKGSPPIAVGRPLYIKSFSIASGTVVNGSRNISIVIHALKPRHTTGKALSLAPPGLN
jgi:hypothetical protein